MNGESIGRTLIDWGMKRGCDDCDCHYRRNQDAMRWVSQRSYACMRKEKALVAFDRLRLSHGGNYKERESTATPLEIWRIRI